MLVTKITSSYSNQSSNTYLKKQYRQSTNIIVSSDAFCKTSFCGIQPRQIKWGKGLARKTYRVLTGKDRLFVNVSENSRLGKEPVFCYSYRKGKRTIREVDAKEFGIDKNYKAKWVDSMCEMEKCGDVYEDVPSCSTLNDRLFYAVYYKDTGKWDDNHGKGYTIDPLKIVNSAISFDKKEHNQPLLRIIRSGTTKGKVIVSDTLSKFLIALPKSDEPVIAVVGDFGKESKYGAYIPPNVKSVVFTKIASSTLKHKVAYAGSQVAASAVLYDEKKIKTLQKMAGKFINLDISQDSLKWKHIKPIIFEPQDAAQPEIKIPEIVTSYKLLKSEEYKPELVASKAYKLRKLEEMKARGGLKDVIIPSSFVIPSGIYDKTLAANPEIAKDIERRIQKINGIPDSDTLKQELEELRHVIYEPADFGESSPKIPEEIQQEITAFKNGLSLENFKIARSSFNGEDAKGHSTAGLYDSELENDFWMKSIFGAIKSVWSSKWNYRAYLSRRKNNIDHAKIKPIVMIQDFIDADYRFTIYTKDPESSSRNRLLIEMGPGESINPYTIRYDKDKKEVKIEQIARKPRNIILDDKFRIVSADSVDDPILSNLEQWNPLLKKVCNAAEEIEKEFGAPQDIEGGIKLGAENNIDNAQIYFWQTRDQII